MFGARGPLTLLQRQAFNEKWVSGRDNNNKNNDKTRYDTCMRRCATFGNRRQNHICNIYEYVAIYNTHWPLKQI